MSTTSLRGSITSSSNMRKSLPRRLGGELHVAHTYALPQPMSVPEGAPIVDISEEVEAEHRKAFDGFLKGYELSAGQTHFLEGLPHQRLPELVEEAKHRRHGHGRGLTPRSRPDLPRQHGRARARVVAVRSVDRQARGVRVER